MCSCSCSCLCSCCSPTGTGRSGAAALGADCTTPPPPPPLPLRPPAMADDAAEQGCGGVLLLLPTKAGGPAAEAAAAAAAVWCRVGAWVASVCGCGQRAAWCCSAPDPHTRAIESGAKQIAPSLSLSALVANGKAGHVGGAVSSKNRPILKGRLVEEKQKGARPRRQSAWAVSNPPARSKRLLGKGGACAVLVPSCSGLECPPRLRFPRAALIGAGGQRRGPDTSAC